MLRNHAKAFTLAELLICLMIVGEIATFTIPKVIASQQNSRFLTASKEDVATIYTAYNQLQVNGQASTSTKIADLTPYMNYVKVISNGSLTLDQTPTTANLTCDSSYPCIIMHNGSAIQFDAIENFGGTATTNAISFQTDPDAKVTDGTTNGPGKAAMYFIFYNGRLTDIGNTLPNTTTSRWTFSPSATLTPSWFKW